MRACAAFALALASMVGGCGSCSRTGDASRSDAATPLASSSSVVAEALPRCRAAGGPNLVLEGENVVVGDVAISPSSLFAGVVRNNGKKTVASLLVASLDLASSRMIDLGPSFGDDPPPSPRFALGRVFLASFARHASDGGAALRALNVMPVDDGGLGKAEFTVLQQADESTAFDVAWPEEAGGSPLVAWDEDAPRSPDGGNEERGFVKVQSLEIGARPRVASPETSDAESPKLLARPSGFWLAWLARRPEGEEGSYVEGPGEKRAYRWVEAIALDPHGQAKSPVHRISPEKGRASDFELATAGERLVVIVEDEAASGEGAGGRVHRYILDGDRVESSDLVDGGVGHVELVATTSAAPRFLAWSDPQERAHLTAVSPALEGSMATAEPSLDGARVVATGANDVLYALIDGRSGDHPAGRPEIRRFSCPTSPAPEGVSR